MDCRHLGGSRILFHLPFRFQHLDQRGDDGISFAHLYKHNVTVRSVSGHHLHKTYIMPDSRNETWLPRPMTMWSSSAIPITADAPTSRFVTTASSRLGVGSPLGWFCATITACAPQRMASKAFLIFPSMSTACCCRRGGSRCRSKAWRRATGPRRRAR